MGFVYRDETINKNQFVAGRYAIICCIADAEVVGFLAQWKNQKHLKLNQWVEVTGKLGVIKREDMEQPLIYIQHVKKVHAPKDPYIYFF